MIKKLAYIFGAITLFMAMNIATGFAGITSQSLGNVSIACEDGTESTTKPTDMWITTIGNDGVTCIGGTKKYRYCMLGAHKVSAFATCSGTCTYGSKDVRTAAYAQNVYCNVLYPAGITIACTNSSSTSWANVAISTAATYTFCKTRCEAASTCASGNCQNANFTIGGTFYCANTTGGDEGCSTDANSASSKMFSSKCQGNTGVPSCGTAKCLILGCKSGYTVNSDKSACVKTSCSCTCATARTENSVTGGSCTEPTVAGGCAFSITGASDSYGTANLTGCSCP